PLTHGDVYFVQHFGTKSTDVFSEVFEFDARNDYRRRVIPIDSIETVVENAKIIFEDGLEARGHIVVNGGSHGLRSLLPHLVTFSFSRLRLLGLLLEPSKHLRASCPRKAYG